MDKKIYIVTSGEYSDYHVDAVFSTRMKAQDYIQQHGTDYRIEGYDLDEEVVKNMQLWGVAFNISNGELSESFPYGFPQKDNVRDTCYIEETIGFSKTKFIYFYVDADTMDKAIKIASERFAAVKANEYIWQRLTTPCGIHRYGLNKYETFNVKTNEFTKL